MYLPSLLNRHVKSTLFLLEKEFKLSNGNSQQYPHLYLPNLDGNEKMRICQKLRSYIQTGSTLVFCMYSERDTQQKNQQTEFKKEE